MNKFWLLLCQQRTCCYVILFDVSKEISSCSSRLSLVVSHCWRLSSALKISWYGFARCVYLRIFSSFDLVEAAVCHTPLHASLMSHASSPPPPPPRPPIFLCRLSASASVVGDPPLSPPCSGACVNGMTSAARLAVVDCGGDARAERRRASVISGHVIGAAVAWCLAAVLITVLLVSICQSCDHSEGDNAWSRTYPVCWHVEEVFPLRWQPDIGAVQGTSWLQWHVDWKGKRGDFFVLKIISGKERFEAGYRFLLSL